MNQELKISFIEKIRKAKTGNKFVDGVLAVLIILIYPIILLFGLLAMLFAGLLSIWQRLTIGKENWEKQKQEILEIEKQNKQWRFFTSAGNIQIEQQLAGSLPWDSGNYLHLKANPIIPYLTDKLFGDWAFVDFEGVFLQKWNHTRNIDCDLVFLDFNTSHVIELIKGLRTKDWTAEKINADEIKFTFITTENNLIYIASRKKL